MAFVNEYISQEDIEKYGISEIQKYFRYRGRDWTADHEREMYLMCVDNGMGPDGATGEQEWIFIWHGYSLWLQIKIIDTKAARNEAGWVHYKVTTIGVYDQSKSRLFPAKLLDEEMNNQRKIIFDNLKEALTAYKGSCVFSTLSDFEVTLDVELGGDYVAHL